LGLAINVISGPLQAGNFMGDHIGDKTGCDGCAIEVNDLDKNSGVDFKLVDEQRPQLPLAVLLEHKCFSWSAIKALTSSPNGKDRTRRRST